MPVVGLSHGGNSDYMIIDPRNWVIVVLLIAGRLAREIDNVGGSFSHALHHFA